MSTSRTILQQLKNLPTYLQQFNQQQWSSAFEHLTSEAVSRILHIPYHDATASGQSNAARVVWHGDSKTITKAPPGGPDAEAYCHGYHIVIEATMNTGTKQWTREFASAIRHTDDFVKKCRCDKSSVFTLLICTKLHPDTYNSIFASNGLKYTFLPLTTAHVGRILETSMLAFSVRHFDIRGLLHGIAECISRSPSVDRYSDSLEGCLDEWQKKILQQEQVSFIAANSYKTIRKMGRWNVGSIEILSRLRKNTVVGKYMNIVGVPLDVNLVKKSITESGLGNSYKLIGTGEDMFEIVTANDFRERQFRMVDAISG